MPDFADSSDVLNLSSALRRHTVNRVLFNPDNQDHIDSLKVFLRTGNWGKFQFYCEHPFTDVPMTVLMTFAMGELGVTRESRAEQLERYDEMNLSVVVEETPDQKRERLENTNAMTALQMAAA